MNTILISFLIASVPLALGYGALVRRQNQRARAGRRMGGRIAPAKALWLFYTLWTWLLLVPLLVSTAALPSSVRLVWGGFALAMWLRVPVEGYLMFVSKNWRPPIGIAHDAACLAWLVLAGALCMRALPWTIWVFHGGLVLAVAMETYYAWGFWQIVGAGTQGDDAVWFASEQDPRFAHLVRVTGRMNGPIVAALVPLLLALVL
ncbi:hypothetical protein [Haliangium ochraceum]|uniref:Uncharacterized protein n=1 Tax=Haliangium ochraceum (strain DSM 14365 / JCM 11303 / SMP-2) TaxID=502025 RepID=D0LSN2_HALO1|nr:hypothetical protein [Haliangium ochraceum]ACY17254.1 conserved hypothetical protein [Haliangium ochraceum DSM 14365]